MTDKKTFFLVHSEARRRAIEAIKTAPDGFKVTIEPPKRNAEQNAKFHAICSDIAKSNYKFAGKLRTAEQWKVLLVSGHAVATSEGHELAVGLEGEMVNLRESTALMSVKRSASLITYALAWCDLNGIKTKGYITDV